MRLGLSFLKVFALEIPGEELKNRVREVD